MLKANSITYSGIALTVLKDFGVKITKDVIRRIKEAKTEIAVDRIKRELILARWAKEER